MLLDIIELKFANHRAWTFWLFCDIFLFQVILDEPGVKEEPQEVEEEVTETKEIIESQFSFDPLTESDSRTEAGGGGGNSSGSTGAPGYDPQIMGSQPQSMEELVAQAIPGSSGLQGVSLSNQYI